MQGTRWEIPVAWSGAEAVKMERGDAWKVDFPGMVMDQLWRENDDLRDSDQISDSL